MKNTISAVAFLIFLLFLIVACAYYFCGFNIAWKVGLVSAVLLLFFSYTSCFWIIEFFRAKKVGHEYNLELYNLVDKISEKLRVIRPDIYIYKSHQANIFIAGKGKQKNALIISDSLITTLNSKEIEAVLTFQIQKIKYGNVLTATLIAIFSGLFLFLLLYILHKIENENDKNISPVAICLFIVFLPMLMFFSLIFYSKNRIYKEDQITISITKDPVTLATAIYKTYVSARMFYNMKAEFNPCVSHLFFVNPLRSAILSFFFSTHPNIHKRIDAVLNTKQERVEIIPQEIKDVFKNLNYFKTPWYKIF